MVVTWVPTNGHWFLPMVKCFIVHLYRHSVLNCAFVFILFYILSAPQTDGYLISAKAKQNHVYFFYNSIFITLYNTSNDHSESDDH